MAEAHAEKVKETARMEAVQKGTAEAEAHFEEADRQREENAGVVHVGADAVPEDVTMDKTPAKRGPFARLREAMKYKAEAQAIEAEKPRPGIFRRKDKK